MNPEFQVINAIDFDKIIGKRPFVALPQEEIDRLYASLEVLPAGQNEAEENHESIQLGLFVVAHYNYSWLINWNTGSTTLSLGFFSPLLANPNGDLFLDESIKTEAKRVFDENVHAKTRYDIRLAGLIYDESTTFGIPRLGITCICRLKQVNQPEATKQGVEMGIMGNGELLQKRNLFDHWSTILIDNITSV